MSFTGLWPWAILKNLDRVFYSFFPKWNKKAFPKEVGSDGKHAQNHGQYGQQRFNINLNNFCISPGMLLHVENNGHMRKASFNYFTIFEHTFPTTTG